MLETFNELENYLDNLNATLDQEEKELHKYLVKNHFRQTSRYPKNSRGESKRRYFNNQIKSFINYVLKNGFNGYTLEEGDRLFIQWDGRHYGPQIVRKRNGSGAESDMKNFKSNVEMLHYIEGYNQAVYDLGKN